MVKERRQELEQMCLLIEESYERIADFLLRARDLDYQPEWQAIEAAACQLLIAERQLGTGMHDGNELLVRAAGRYVRVTADLLADVPGLLDRRKEARWATDVRRRIERLTAAADVLMIARDERRVA